LGVSADAGGGGKASGRPSGRSKDEDDEDDEKPRRKRRGRDDDDRPRRPGRDRGADDEVRPARGRRGTKGYDDEDERRGDDPKGKKGDEEQAGKWGNRFDDDEGDRPARRKRRDDDDGDGGRGEGQKKASVLGIIALVGGIGGLCLSVIPCVGVFGLVPCGLSLLMGLGAVVQAKNSDGRIGKGVPISAAAVSLLGLAIAGVWFGVLSSAGNLADDKAGDAAPPALTVSAVALDREYDRNVAASDAKYKDKFIEVTGRVNRVTDEVARGRLTVELRGDPNVANSTVDCVFSKDKKSELAALAPNDYVAIRGTCVGKVRRQGGDTWVTLEKCTGFTKDPPKDKPKDKDKDKGGDKADGRVKGMTFTQTDGVLMLVVNGEVKNFKLTADSRYIDKFGKQIKSESSHDLLKEDVTVTLGKVNGADVVLDVVQKKYVAPAGERIEGRVKGMTWDQKGGVLFLAVNGVEKKFKITEDSRFFDADGDQIHDDITTELLKEDVGVILGKVNGEDVVLDVRQKKLKK
jgi:hypothetical protein